jgi:hypothetical protein
LTLSPAARAVQSLAATNTRTFTDTRLGLSVVAAEVTLPAGEWDVASVSPANALEQVYLTPRALARPGDVSRRVSASQIQRSIDSGMWRVQMFHSAIVDYARTHNATGPREITDLDPSKWMYVIEAYSQSPWPDERDRSTPGPPYFLVPATPIPPSTAGRPASKGSVPLVLELRPYINDGKHWVLFANGAVERVPVDKALLAKYRLTLRPVRADTAIAGTPDPLVVHGVFAVAPGGTAGPVTLTLTEAASARRLEVRWTLAGSRSDPAALTEWAQARQAQWWGLVDHGEGSILRAWMARSEALYGAPKTQPANNPDDAFRMMMRREEPRTTDTFGILGGRAALRETLQLQLLRSGEPPGAGFAAASAIAISTLKGVEVVSLPFETMLGGRTGGSLPLADRVPADRLLIHFSKPAALFPFLDKGGDFLARAGSFVTASAFDDDLKARYLRRLGLGERAGRAFIESGGVTELALVASDLFFIDGTDVTILMRVKSPDLVAGGLRLLGVADVAAQGITEKPTTPGRSAFWARQGDLLMVASSRKDVEQILQLGGNPAASLGRSAEFRYMLTEMPVRAETRALVYLSDPFIRRMVGPAVKIGQLRRMQARADMVFITAGALLYRLDGHRDVPTLPRLLDLGYVPRTISAARYTLRDDLSVLSPDWGTLADMKSIDSSAITSVNSFEAEAYRRYMDEYTRFWRQFFDPIAIRLDDAPNGELELSTFILPLIDSDLYNGVRGVFQPAEGGGKLRVPLLAPDPVMQLSLNLTDSAWVSVSGDWSRMFSEYTGLSPEMFDLLGPGLHVAIQDADPIITTGTGDLLGAFSSPTAGRFGGGFDMMLPFALSVFTRPCKIMVELQDPKRALELLRLAGTRASAPNRFPLREAAEFRQIEGRDAWVYTFGVPGIVTLRLGLEIQNGFLVISNTPWAKPVTIQSADARPFNGAAIRVVPDAVREGLAGLFATQAEHDQMAALSSMSALLPLLQTGSATPAEAAARHATLFGSRPLHPKTGDWVWANGKLQSSVYGSATQWRVPMYKPEVGGFGLFDGTTLLDLNMQFEQGGLRATARWKSKD